MDHFHCYLSQKNSHLNHFYEFSAQQFGNLLHKIIIMKIMAFGIFGQFGSKVDDPIQCILEKNVRNGRMHVWCLPGSRIYSTYRAGIGRAETMPSAWPS